MSMKSKSSIVLILTSLALMLSSCADRPPAEESCNFVQNSFGRRVSWATLPLKFYVDERAMSPQHIVGLKAAAQVWNDALGRNAIELICSTNDPSDLACVTSQLPAPEFDADGKTIPDGFNGIYFMDGPNFEKDGTRDEQARTSIAFRGDFMFEADILIDLTEDFFFGTEQQLSSSRTKISFESLLVHEFGHALGLEHIDHTEGSVMNSRLQQGQSRNTLSEVEFDSLACEYQ